MVETCHGLQSTKNKKMYFVSLVLFIFYSTMMLDGITCSGHIRWVEICLYMPIYLVNVYYQTNN